MKNSIIAFLIGALTALIIYLKKKNPDIVNVSGDLIEEQKIKDNRKIKTRGKGNTQNVSQTFEINPEMSNKEIRQTVRSCKDARK